MSQYKIPLEDIEKFLLGYDDEKYIVNLEYDYNENLIYKFKHLPNGDKVVETEPLQAFMWIKDLSQVKDRFNFYNRSIAAIKSARKEYGITIKELRHDDIDRLKNGYRYILKCNQGYNRMLDFFVNGGIPYGVKNLAIKDHFYILKPVEQYLISTSKRLFKGYDEYKDIDRLIFDLETTGLDPRFSRIFLIGIKNTKGFEVVFECETEGENADQSEIKGILKFFKVLETLKPAVNVGHNVFNFDWDFIFKRCEILGINITDIAKTLKEGKTIYRYNKNLKTGGESEEFTYVKMFGFSNIDTEHAAKRAQAIDSSLKFTNLKYLCRYNKINKKNRVYIKGDNIGKMWHDKDTYYFEDYTGTYCKTKPSVEYMKFISRDFVQQNKDKIFVFGDNNEGVGFGGQAKEMRGEPNTIGIPTKKSPLEFYSDIEYEENKNNINKAVNKIINELKKGKTIVFPKDGIGTGLAKLSEVAPKTNSFLTKTLGLLENFVNSYKECDGKYIVNRYLMDDLWETIEVDNVYNQATFLLTKLLPTTFENLTTCGSAVLWQLLMCSWSYDNDLAIPIPEPKRDFVGGLSRLFRVGFSKNMRKKDFNSLYPAINLVHDVFPTLDITGALKSLVKYFHSERFKAKNLAKKYKKEGNLTLSSLYNRKQLPLKIFINALFGSISAPAFFYWGEYDKGEQITCTGRQYLRLAVKFFSKKGYIPTVLDTDGVNFSMPDLELENSFRYTGKGLNSEVIKGFEYKGIHACIAEFNDLYMRGEMAISLDGEWEATTNLSRKNYALLESDGSVNLTGNSIKSKKMPVYLEEFIENGLKLILKGDGYGFVEYYYDYIDKIYNKKIPLQKIATKGKIKKTIEEYNNRGTDKNGRQLPKQAHMELAIEHGLNVHYGDIIYYVNNGTAKSHGDSQINRKTGKMYAEMLDNKLMDGDEPVFGDYNVAKFIDMLNNRIKRFLVNFKPDVRNLILIKNPDMRRNWIYSELELVNGMPFVERDQDDIVKDFYMPSDMEFKFWEKMGYDPNIWLTDDGITKFHLPGFDLVEYV